MAETSFKYSYRIHVTEHWVIPEGLGDEPERLNIRTFATEQGHQIIRVAQGRYRFPRGEYLSTDDPNEPPDLPRNSPPEHDPRLADADVMAIQAIIAELPDHQILYVGLEKDGKVMVRTGFEVTQPEGWGGGGNRVYLEHADGQWRVIGTAIWLS